MAHAPLTILAEAEAGDFFKPVLALLVTVLALVIVVQALRKWMSRGADLSDVPAAGFSLDSLRQLVKDGRMTPEEFEKAKAQIVQATQRAVERAKPVSALPPDLKSPPEMPK